MRLVLSVLCVGALAAVIGPAIAQQAQTTRIENRPVYGAIVSFEHGVRVYRPVPPTQHLIINPDARTPLTVVIDGVNGVVQR